MRIDISNYKVSEITRYANALPFEVHIEVIDDKVYLATEL